MFLKAFCEYVSMQKMLQLHVALQDNQEFTFEKQSSFH